MARWCLQEVAKKNTKYQSNPSAVEEDERKKILAYLFMDGADVSIYGPLLKDLHNDFALGKQEIYPLMPEDALQVLTMYMGKEAQTSDDDEAKVLLAQPKMTLKCWQCGEKGHLRKDCPHQQQHPDESSNLQVPYWAGGAGR